jgi:hypothetical protein
MARPSGRFTLPEQIGMAAHHILHVAFRHAARREAMGLRFGAAMTARSSTPQPTPS